MCGRCTGFVLQAIGRRGTTAAELGRVLGISKQAAGKTIGSLGRLGYLYRERDSNDGRRVALTEQYLASRLATALAREMSAGGATRQPPKAGRGPPCLEFQRLA